MLPASYAHNMAAPSYVVQRVLAATLLEMLRSGELSPEDAEWVRQFAVRLIAEFNLAKSRRENPEEPLAA